MRRTGRIGFVALVCLAGACAELGDEFVYEDATGGPSGRAGSGGQIGPGGAGGDGGDGGGGGGAGGGGSGGTAEVSFEEVQAIFTANCTSSSCHSGRRPAAGLSLVEGQAYTALLGPGGHGGVPAALCRDEPLVDPGDPDNSCLWLLIDDGQMPPPPFSDLPAAEAETIRRWIEAGAPGPGE